MKAVVERCAGIDVAKDTLNVCAMCGPADQDPAVELEKFRTFNAELDRLSARGRPRQRRRARSGSAT